jgi:hypothetical protein
MTPSIKSYPLVDKLIDIFGDWLKHSVSKVNSSLG